MAKVDNLLIEPAIEIIFPKVGDTLEAQWMSCFKQIVDFQSSNNDKKIIKGSCFINVDRNEDYISFAKLINANISSLKDFVPFSIISQAPYKQSVSVEIIYANADSISQVKTIVYDGVSYLKFEGKGGSYLVIAGLGALSEITNIEEQAAIAFKKARNILNFEGLDFGNVVRQWNYIEKIVDYTGKNQHYQVFNDVRTEYYSGSNFIHGYPAATGIGMACGGIVIDLIAFKSNGACEVFPVKSPVQYDAHKYTEEVLIASSVKKLPTSPKFERAKVLQNHSGALIFISGTAAIKGQDSDNINQVDQQSINTIENINSLVGKENLKQCGIVFEGTVNISYLRVYVKRREMFADVVKAVERSIPDNIKTLYLEADICRPELLVEIEGLGNICK